MTDKEYEKELSEVLSGTPNEFHNFVLAESWEKGHSSGYEEVILAAQNLVDGLLPGIKEFEKRVLWPYQAGLDKPKKGSAKP
jgi:hypothetical protein